MKFKVGDIIKGTMEADVKYAYTTSKSKCRVVEVYGYDGYGDIEVEIIDHETLKSCIGEVYEVEEYYFELVIGGAKLR